MAAISGKVHFPNLDSLRFIGSLVIILLHIKGILVVHGKEDLTWTSYFINLGNLDVSLFFVLSGFLITYLLLKEKKETNTIAIKKFYQRRILKIVPLYYLVLILGFFVLPHFDGWFTDKYSANVGFHFWRCFIGVMLFLPAVFFSKFGLPETIGVTWSVRVEEAFYLVWPHFIKRTKSFIRTSVFIIAALVAVRVALILMIDFMHIQGHKLVVANGIMKLLLEYRFCCMLIGGIGAYIVIHDHKKILSVLYRKDVQFGIYGLLAVLLITNLHIPVVQFELFSVLFACIILNLACNSNSIVNIDYGWMNYLGKISYGLYLYNPITRIFCFEFIQHVFGRPIAGWQMISLMYITCIASTVGISILSYEFIEKPFLRRKQEVIPT